MGKTIIKSAKVGSKAEELFVELFCETFGPDKAKGGEKPEAYIDMPINIDDFQLIDLFNWQNEVKDMLSLKEFIRSVDVQYMDSNGRVFICDIVRYFIDFYENRKNKGLIAEKPASIYQKGGFTEKDVERNIFNNPFKRCGSYAGARIFLVLNSIHIYIKDSLIQI